jgi:hypothetical protein
LSIFLLFSQRTWAINTVQALLGAACLEWLPTAWAAWLAGRSKQMPMPAE